MTLSLDPLADQPSVWNTGRLIHQGPKCTTHLIGLHTRPTRGGKLLSMRSRKQTEWQQFLMESSLAYPRRKEGKVETQKGGKNWKKDQALGYLGVVNSVTFREDVLRRGPIADVANEGRN
ncbi:hypothetical protein AVEN_225255-1 [Araneus ventricosus]|uniref:Uncharacterized protein n=1 Tax=Araneus ventricosus TaxID=182803 RepID=A0A4Y2ANI5_ARAVE|nr:hypothetical protein AVEN_225255-1 [Araneus ventricosus]